jgi:benzoyl-CoA reductase/2-hydroxyglutaryl-CoA dehydratase subunit BcrC/BadD/HgdB
VLPGLRTDGELECFSQLASFFVDYSERAKARGEKIVGTGPLSPGELLMAAGALPYDMLTHENMLQSMLGERTELVHGAVEAGMSPELSPWNLIMLGSLLKKQELLTPDLISSAVGGFDDQLTKSFQVIALARALPLRFWEVPGYDPDAEKWALAYLKKELEQLARWLKLQTGNTVKEDGLRRAIALTNTLRKDMQRLDVCLCAPKVPITGLDYYFIHMLMGDLGLDPRALHQLFLTLLDELEARVQQGFQPAGIQPAPTRVYIVGDETQELSLFNAIENYGGCLVGCDFRLPVYHELIEEDADPFTALASWTWRMPNNMTASLKIQTEIAAIRRQKPDAVIISSVVGSRHFPGSERLVRDVVREELGIPTLSIETTLPHENGEKVDYQIRAFMEMMR